MTVYTQNNTTTRAKFSTYTKSSSARPNVDIISVKNITTTGNNKVYSGGTAAPKNVKKPLQVSNINSLLPRLASKPFPAFHAQSKMYRTANDDKPEGASNLSTSTLLNYSSDDDDDGSDSDSSSDND